MPGAVTLSNGRFFPLPEGTPYRGFAVLDEQDGPAFATAYHQHGGYVALGRPVSRSFQLTDGAIYQLFAHGLLRWQPGTPTAAVTTVDLLAFVTLHGLEDQLWWLGVPRRAPPWDERLTPTPAPSARLEWLTEPAIAAHYRGPVPADGQGSADGEQTPVPAGMTLYGWPESRPEHLGASIAQRFERAVLIVWVTPPADGPAAGTVEVLPLGPLVARTSVFQGLATAPDTLVGGRSGRPRAAAGARLAGPADTDADGRATDRNGDGNTGAGCGGGGGRAADCDGRQRGTAASTWSLRTRAARRRTCRGGCWRAHQVERSAIPSQM